MHIQVTCIVLAKRINWWSSIDYLGNSYAQFTDFYSWELVTLILYSPLTDCVYLYIPTKAATLSEVSGIFTVYEALSAQPQAKY